ncbi:transmembrane protein 163 [Arvicola amphibius]|uniref:transmembrane protein 163 n=1 Tax=Arvicola amphibius TaxID=1047088 RepID=UPI001C0978BC|nr:transmembrane protein 163 [Arvicola amphibius]
MSTYESQGTPLLKNLTPHISHNFKKHTSLVKRSQCKNENSICIALTLTNLLQSEFSSAWQQKCQPGQQMWEDLATGNAAIPRVEILDGVRVRKACVILGVIFLLSSICIVVKAIHDLSTRLLPEVDDFLFSVSILSGILCSVLAVLKFMLGKVLTSRALITDGFNSLVGGVMGFSILLSAEVFKHNAKVWYLDGSIGVLIGLTIFAYGVKLLIDMVPRVRQTRHYEMFE